MKLVTCMGGVWKLSDRNYKRYLRQVASGKEWNLNDFGRNLGFIDLNVTDIEPEAAQDLLKGEEPSGRLIRHLQSEDQLY